MSAVTRRDKLSLRRLARALGLSVTARSTPGGSVSTADAGTRSRATSADTAPCEICGRFALIMVNGQRMFCWDCYCWLTRQRHWQTPYYVELEPYL